MSEEKIPNITKMIEEARESYLYKRGGVEVKNIAAYAAGLSPQSVEMIAFLYKLGQQISALQTEYHEVSEVLHRRLSVEVGTRKKSIVKVLSVNLANGNIRYRDLG